MGKKVIELTTITHHQSDSRNGRQSDKRRDLRESHHE